MGIPMEITPLGDPKMGNFSPWGWRKKPPPEEGLGMEEECSLKRGIGTGMGIILNGGELC
ncbi:hypothetical protein A2U01_0081003, partial [Trifolium medium]|nr:hypothetical protein [Trifolium medium]